MHTYDYDLFTIGGGSGGVRASRFAAQYGARVALAESGPLGGTCVNAGCIPKKLMSYAAHYHADFAEAAGFGWSVGEQKFDWATLIANKDNEIARLNGVYSQILENAKVHVIKGHAQIVDAHTVAVNGQQYRVRHILIATGGHPVRPELPGAELGITSDEFFHLPALPRHAVVQGGGYIAVELASILNGLGCKVTLVQRGTQILRNMDHDLGHFLVNEMRKKGVDVALDTRIMSVAAHGNIRQVMLSDGRTLDSDCVLFATGRQPNIKNLGLENAGVLTRENGAIIVDEHFATNVDSIHAIGDVIDRVALTPVALAEGMIVAANLFQHGRKLMSYEHIPTAVFSHPNVATLGLSEAKAREKHQHISIFKSEFKPLKHTLSGSTERCLMKIIVDTGTDRVLGMHMVGPEAGEIIQGFAVAMQCGVTKAQLDATIGVHPTLAEEFVTMRTAVV
ncbi:glutathione-disulfide reductase [Undibacterium sp. TS12]|uniref:glutathione-disulfide reductase n=1 Tax=Undibacterium sp. TS12 TaxID=2908202 RepID=UPI001F4C65AD|nr:glutathione-disulfide reductase [Undibacterium sp. TS12]MCH8620282.1 glutathione-disulfide reductase [Undibacterium sp. TS12]